MGRSTSGLLSVLVLCLAAAACGPNEIKLAPTTPGTLGEARKYLQGHWTLDSFEVFPPGQPPVRLVGSGILDYDEFSNMKIEIRPAPDSAEVLRRTGIVLENGIISSTGRTAIDLQNKTITYTVQGQPGGFVETGPLALNRPRHYVVDANVLTLTTKNDAGASLSVSRWRKQP